MISSVARMPEKHECEIIPLFGSTPMPVVEAHSTKRARAKNYGYKNSPLTAAGKPKPQAASAVKSLEDIEAINKYFYETGTIEWIRLRNWCMWNLGIALGFRISDLLSLRMCDIMYQNGDIKDAITVYEKKTGKRRISKLTDKSKNVIIKYINSLERAGIDTSPKNNDFYYSYLFRSNGSDVLDTRSAHRIMKKMSRDLNLPYNVGTHTLRKTFAYWTIKQHSDDAEILTALQKLLNHSDQRVTMSYACIDEDVLDELYEDVSDLLLEDNEGEDIDD